MDSERIRKNVQKYNPKAAVIETDLELTPSREMNIYGKRVIVIEDGPTITHGGMKFGAGFEYAARNGAEAIDPRPFAVGSIKEIYSKYDHIGEVIPAMGYYGKQVDDLAETINRSKADVVISGTPVDLTRILKVDIPVLHVSYVMKEREGSIEKAVSRLL
jgi:predicted GTPase